RSQRRHDGLAARHAGQHAISTWPSPSVRAACTTSTAMVPAHTRSMQDPLRLVMSAERCLQRATLQASDREAWIESLGTHTCALADAVTAPDAVAPVHLAAAGINAQLLFALVGQDIECPKQLHRTQVVGVAGDHRARRI